MQAMTSMDRALAAIARAHPGGSTVSLAEEYPSVFILQSTGTPTWNGGSAFIHYIS